ncbi:CrcB family protein [Microbacterium esteraromaticum]|uniref:Fluoride-specific ion channel FluC n=1 Tax=Microbacterium esteraromaticum TaxID=57043 RepID=A0A939ISC7_9MICO|nr:CrcB family protein [Microbacterium esteraromaticum]MBN8205042.1 CrcB family protein [Microbacterium esteraromaticum]MBN8415196.1 CrcB family protein [Microbacterium esteraromaticum]
MTPLLFVLAAVCGGLGAGVRYLVDTMVARYAGARFPGGVMLINVTGSLALGVVVGALPESAFVIGAGFLGGYTTFSTAMVDTVALWRDGARRASALNAVGMLVLAILAAGGGLLIGRAL